MGLLTSQKVHQMIKAGDLLVEPFVYEEKLTPASSIDLRLSPRLIHYDFPDKEYLLGDDIPDDVGRTEELEHEEYGLEPGHCALFVLYEKIRLPSSVAGLVVPRSSLTRLGVSLQPTYLNPGYEGKCPVLLSNQMDFKVRIPFRGGVGPRVAQVLFLTLTSQPHRLYGEGPEEKYQFEEGSPARFYKDVDIMKLIEPFKKALDEK